MKTSISEVQGYLGEENRKRIGKVMKEVRRKDARKISQAEMAEILRVDRQHINKVENGKICANADELMVYSQLFECPVDLFLYGLPETIYVDKMERIRGKFLPDY